MSFWTDKYQQLKQLRIESSRTRSILLYLSFVAISAAFWAFLTAGEYMTRSIEIPVEYRLPASARFLTPVPDTITVTIKERGRFFLRAMFGQVPRLTIAVDAAEGEGTFKYDAAHLRKAIVRLLGAQPQEITILPESITARYSEHSKRVPVKYDIVATPAATYVQNGFVEHSTDSVIVFADSKTLKQINEVYTYHVKETDLRDTLRRTVHISPLKGAVVEPPTVSVVVPIEKLRPVTKTVPVVVRNAPPGVSIVFFPASVDVHYYAPESLVRSTDGVVTIVVDYNTIDLTTAGNKAAVQVGEASGVFHDVTPMIDSVEYIIEKK